MELPYAAEGIILASDKYREKDRLLTIYTRELGKNRVISRGSRKMDSKLAPHLEPLAWVNLMLVNGKAIATLTGSSEIKNFSRLKSKGVYTLLALHLAELVDKATLENLPDEKIFNLLLDLLSYLDRPKPKLAIAEIIMIFKVKLLEFLGLCPQEISAPSGAMSSMTQSDFFGLENISWEKAPKQKLDKILSSSFADILNQPMSDFNKLICLSKEQKVV